MKQSPSFFLAALWICAGLLATSCATATATATATANTSASVSAEGRYWERMLSIDVKLLENGAIPFSEAWFQAIPAIQNGQSEKYVDFFQAVKEYRPHVKRTLDAFGDAQPPSGETALWQGMRLEELKILLEALGMYERCWDYDKNLVSGTTEALLAADEKLYEFQSAREKADLMQKKALIRLLRKAPWEPARSSPERQDGE
jgi:tetratricopeptide (TPR) repeat protein